MSALQRQRLRRADRLCSGRRVREIMASARRWNGGRVQVWASPSLVSRHRLCVVAPRALGNAVARNHTKRLVREAFRMWRKALPRYLDVVILPKTSASSVAGLAAELERWRGEYGEAQRS